MSKAWMPFYVGDFLADTMHLSATETGIYMRLIMHCWQHGTIPLDDRKLALIAHCDTRLWHQYKGTVLQFFDVVDASTAHHKRVSTELQRCAEISNKRKVAAEQKHQKEDANQVQLHTQSQSQSHKKKEPSCAVATATRTRAGQHFEEFWKVYPRRDGANPKHPAESKFLAAIKSGIDPGEIISAAARYAQEVRDRGKERTPFVAQAVVWLNQRRWIDYPEPTPEPAESNGQVWLSQDTLEFDAWEQHSLKTTGKRPPRDRNGGWWFPARRPPDYPFLEAAE